MSFEKCFRHFLAGSGALPMISQKPSFLRVHGEGQRLRALRALVSAIEVSSAVVGAKVYGCL
jgi:hypothetical protein